VNAILRSELQVIGDRVELPDDGEGANESRTQLPTGQAHLDVPS